MLTCRFQLVAWWARFSGVLLAVALSGVDAATLTRSMNSHFTPGVPLSVVLTAEPEADTAAYSVEERFPPGWMVSGVSHGGVVDVVNHSVKWGPFTEIPSLVRTLTYTLTPPSDARGEHSWSGEGWFNATGVPTTGQTTSARFPGTLTRLIPSAYVPGQSLVVTLQAVPAADVKAYAVEEGIPAGWMVSAINEDGEFDALNRKVKWGPFTDDAAIPQDFSLTLTPPLTASGGVELRGRAVFDAVEVLAVDWLPRQASLVTVTLPATFEPAVELPLSLSVTPAVFVQVYAIEQQLPTGWSASAVSHEGVFDPGTRKLKWGPFTDPIPHARTLTAQLLPPVDSADNALFPGTAVFDADVLSFSAGSQRWYLNPDHAVTSVLAPEFEPGLPFDVTLTVTPRDGTSVYSIEDTLPAGWSFLSADSDGIYDPTNRKVKWGPFIAPDTGSRVLRYQAQPAPTTVSNAEFSGAGWFGDTFQAITGDRLSVAPAGRLTRTLPARYTPGVPFSAQLDAAPRLDIASFAVEEALPEGWTFLAASEGGAFDPVHRRIKWGPFSDALRRTLSYQALPPEEAGPEAFFAGHGVFNRTPMDVTGTNRAVRNTPPRAIPNSVGRLADESAKISAIKIVLNDSDADGDFLTVTAVSPTSAHGADVALIWPWIYYLPPPGFNDTDTFSYTISDGFGGTATALIQVLIEPPTIGTLNIVSIETLADGTRRIRFAGVPSFTYHVEASSDLTAWTWLGDVMAGANGLFEFIDSEAPLFPIRYYRSTWP